MSVFHFSTGLSTVAPLRHKTKVSKSQIFEALFSGCHRVAALHGEQGIAAARDFQPDVLRRRIQHPLIVRSNFPTAPIIRGVSGISRHSRINGKKRSRFIHNGGGWRQLLMKSTPIFLRIISVLILTDKMPHRVGFVNYFVSDSLALPLRQCSRQQGQYAGGTLRKQCTKPTLRGILPVRTRPEVLLIWCICASAKTLSHFGNFTTPLIRRYNENDNSSLYRYRLCENKVFLTPNLRRAEKGSHHTTAENIQPTHPYSFHQISLAASINLSCSGAMPTMRGKNRGKEGRRNDMWRASMALQIDGVQMLRLKATWNATWRIDACMYATLIHDWIANCLMA